MYAVQRQAVGMIAASGAPAGVPPPGAEPAGGPFRESLEAIARELQQSATSSAQPLLMALLRPPAELVPGTEPQLLLR